MKRYVSHKEVDAAKIVAEENAVNDSNTMILTLEIDSELNYQQPVTVEWYRKHSGDNAGIPRSLVGGYFVRYADGYESWSPAEAFENGYTEIKPEQGKESLQINTEQNQFDFSNALFNVRRGRKIARQGWNGKDMYVELQTPTETSKMTLPYLFMKTAQGDLVPWVASQTDVLAEDWCIVE